MFASQVGTELDSHNVRRAFRRVVKDAGLIPKDWTPREMRHSFVSALSTSGVRLEDVARLVGHSGTAVTESVYRHQVVPVMVEGATAMDCIFPKASQPESGEFISTPQPSLFSQVQQRGLHVNQIPTYYEDAQ